MYENIRVPPPPPWPYCMGVVLKTPHACEFTYMISNVTTIHFMLKISGMAIKGSMKCRLLFGIAFVLFTNAGAATTQP